MVRGHSEAPTGSLGPGGSGMSLISIGTSIEVQKADVTSVKHIRDGGMAYVSYDKIKERQRLEALMEEVREKMGNNSDMKPFKDQVLTEMVDNGLRIQIVDKENRSMFESGGAKLKFYTESILHVLAKTINEVPNRISISGHTDASKLSKRRGNYTNWELSSDRANSARRALLDGGLKPEKIGRVIGLADTALYDMENPFSPINRRITIIIMKEEVSELAKQEEAMNATPAELIQENRSIEDIKFTPNSPLSGTALDLKQGSKPKEHLDKKEDPNMSTQLKLHKLHSELKNVLGEENQQKESNGKRKMKAGKKGKLATEEAQYDSGIIILDKGSAKSFIQLPPIIDPALLPGRTDNR
jgi:chemotaxis protein MotB